MPQDLLFFFLPVNCYFCRLPSRSWAPKQVGTISLLDSPHNNCWILTTCVLSESLAKCIILSLQRKTELPLTMQSHASSYNSRSERKPLTPPSSLGGYLCVKTEEDIMTPVSVSANWKDHSFLRPNALRLKTRGMLGKFQYHEFENDDTNLFWLVKFWKLQKGKKMNG